MVRDVGDNHGNSIDELAVASGKIVIDKNVMVRREELSYGVGTNISSTPGHQYLHVPNLLSTMTTQIVVLFRRSILGIGHGCYTAFPLRPTTISELPKGIGKALRVICSKRETLKSRLFAQTAGTLGAAGWE